MSASKSKASERSALDHEESRLTEELAFLEYAVRASQTLRERRRYEARRSRVVERLGEVGDLLGRERGES